MQADALGPASPATNPHAGRPAVAEADLTERQERLVAALADGPRSVDEIVQILGSYSALLALQYARSIEVKDGIVELGAGGGPVLEISKDQPRPGWLCQQPVPAEPWFVEGARCQPGAWVLAAPLTSRWNGRVLVGKPASLSISAKLWPGDCFFQIGVAAVNAWGICVDGVPRLGRRRLFAEYAEVVALIVARGSHIDRLGRMPQGLRDYYGVPVVEIPGPYVSDGPLHAAARELGFENVED